MTDEGGNFDGCYSLGGRDVPLGHVVGNSPLKYHNIALLVLYLAKNRKEGTARGPGERKRCQDRHREWQGLPISMIELSFQHMLYTHTSKTFADWMLATLGH